MKSQPAKTKLLLIIGSVTLVIALSVGIAHRLGYIRFPWEDARMIVGNVNRGPLPGLTDEDLLTQMQQEADESNIRIQLNSRPVFETGESAGNLLLGNPETNRFDMQVEIYLDETEERIYESSRIPPGYFIDYDTLLVNLEAGTHAATARLTYYYGDEVRNRTNFRIEIAINN